MQDSKINMWQLPYGLVKEDAIPSMFCEKLIDKFEKNEEKKQETISYHNRHFTEVNISLYWQDEHDVMVALIQEAWKVYMTTFNIHFDIQFPRQFGYEQFRMKRYLPNDYDQFDLHTDVGSYASARRFLSFLWYLNTVEQGGETIFGINQKDPLVVIPAVRTRLLMFPPLWTHPHKGCKPISGPKYVISGYLHLITITFVYVILLHFHFL